MDTLIPVSMCLGKSDRLLYYSTISVKDLFHDYHDNLSFTKLLNCMSARF